MRTLQQRLVAVLAVLATALFVFVLPGGPASATDSGSTSGPSSSSSSSGSTLGGSGDVTTKKFATFGIGPALPVPGTQEVDGRPYLSYVGSPGGTVNDAVALLNLTRRPVRLNVYAVDATDTSSGDFTLLAKSQKSTDAGKWIHLHLPKSGMVTVPPRHGNHYGRVVVPFTADIPAKASPGDHAAGIIASLASTSKAKKGARIRFEQRIGVRAYFQLSGATNPRVAIKHLQVHYARDRNLKGTGSVSVSYVVQNTGNLRLSVSPLVSLHRWFFSTINKYPPSLPDVLPGSKVVMHQTFKGVKGFGKMKATVSAFATPVDPTVAEKAPPVSVSASFWAWPWLAIAIALAILLLLLLGGTWWWRRRRRKQRLAAAGAAGGPSSRPKTPALARGSLTTP
jgi:hypothetical protein